MIKNLLQVSQADANKLIAAKFSNYDPMCGELEYWAWPDAFGSTTGPFGGIGGQAMTTFTIEAWTDGYYAVLFCQGRVLRVVSEFAPQMRLRG